MKKEKISAALGKIDEKYIEKALNMDENEAKPVKKFAFGVKRYAALAASFAFVLATAFIINNFLDLGKLQNVGSETTTVESGKTENQITTVGGELNGDTTENSPTEGTFDQSVSTGGVAASTTQGTNSVPADNVTTTEGLPTDQFLTSSTCVQGTFGTVGESSWDEKLLCEKFSTFTYNSIAYTSSNSEVSPADIGRYVEKIRMRGYDNGKEQNIYAEIYEISGIDTRVAYAVKFEGDYRYNSYVNRSFAPSTLGEMIDAYGLEEYMTFGHALNEKTAESLVWNMLFSNANAENLARDDGYTFDNRIMTVSVSVEVLGCKNVSLAVTESGYLLANIGSSKKAFFIGADTVDAFVQSVIQSYEGTTDCSTSEELTTSFSAVPKR